MPPGKRNLNTAMMLLHVLHAGLIEPHLRALPAQPPKRDNSGSLLITGKLLAAAATGVCVWWM